MTKRMGVLFGLSAMLGGLLLVTGCDLDGSGGSSKEVDDAIERARAEQASSSSSSSSGSSSRSSSPPASSASGSSAAASSGGGGAGGFVWKPVSEGDGRLVVLLPSSYVGRVSSVQIRRGGAVLESGRFAGNTNGNRPTFRFSRPGAGYGSGLTAVATLRTGGSVSWNIPNGGSRVS
jgi:hypothetical protein